jgi:hypothetical protein
MSCEFYGNGDASIRKRLGKMFLISVKFNQYKSSKYFLLEIELETSCHLFNVVGL